MSRKIQVILAVVVTVVVAVVFYFSFVAPQYARRALHTETATSTTELLTIRHPLTGMLVKEVKPFYVVSVMFDNLSEVKKRPGLEEAAVVYEALAEGGITRIMGLFDSNQEVRTFGPIRSVRPYFIDWAQEYGGILMHVGGSQDALRQLVQTDTLMDIDQIGANERYFSRDETLSAPHNVFSSFSSWRQLTERSSIKPSTFTPWKYEEMKPAVGVADKQQAAITFSPANTVTWLYNKEKNSYARFVNAERQVDTSGEQLAVSNVIIIQVPSGTIDAIGRQRMKTIGQNEARIIRNGEVIEARWVKESKSTRMRFISESQDEVVLAPGTTWIDVVPSLDVVTIK